MYIYISVGMYIKISIHILVWHLGSLQNVAAL